MGAFFTQWCCCLVRLVPMDFPSHGNSRRHSRLHWGHGYTVDRRRGEAATMKATTCGILKVAPPSSHQVSEKACRIVASRT
jgi:hypothetical protein